jgi:hypothetical protein
MKKRCGAPDRKGKCFTPNQHDTFFFFWMMLGFKLGLMFAWHVVLLLEPRGQPFFCDVFFPEIGSHELFAWGWL